MHDVSMLRVFEARYSAYMHSFSVGPLSTGDSLLTPSSADLSQPMKMFANYALNRGGTFLRRDNGQAYLCAVVTLQQWSFGRASSVNMLSR
jgi:hypothetical protein